MTMMSDDDRDIDIESDAENDSDSRTHARNSLGGSGYYSQAEKRAHHNALERKRRDHIKDSFTSLRDSVPALQGEKVASRAQILKKAAEYIQFMRRKNNSHQQDIEDLKRQNSLLETQIRALEKARVTGNFAELGLGIKSEGSSHDTDSSDGEGTTRRVKKLKINGVNIERPLRKRGRPQGKGRAPLSMEERRARNAQYEKERRMETADAMAELAAALGCSEMTNSDLIATAITFLRKANVPDPSQDIQSLKRINENLIMQIQSVEERLVRECQLAGCAITDLSNSEDDSVSVRTNSNNEGRKKLKLNVSGAVLSSPNPGQSYRQLENTRRQAFKTEPTSQTETSLRTKRTFEMQQSLKPEPVAKIQNPYFTMQPIFKAEQALNSEQVIKTEPFLYPWAAYPSASPESFDCTSSDTPIPPVYSDSTIYMEPCFKAQPILEAREALNSELAIKMEPMLSPGVPYQSTSQESFDCSTSENSQTSIAASRGYDEFRRSDTQTFPSETVAGLDGAFDGVLDFMRHWTVEDFIEEYL